MAYRIAQENANRRERFAENAKQRARLLAVRPKTQHTRPGPSSKRHGDWVSLRGLTNQEVAVFTMHSAQDRKCHLE
jgi:hypothetical protein